MAGPWRLRTALSPSGRPLPFRTDRRLSLQQPTRPDPTRPYTQTAVRQGCTNTLGRPLTVPCSTRRSL